jgi:hypothetical protein
MSNLTARKIVWLAMQDPALAASQQQEVLGKHKSSVRGNPGKAALEAVLSVGPDGEAISFEEVRP